MMPTNLVPQPQPRSIYQCQTANVRELEKAWEQTNRLINESYRLNDKATAIIQTKLMGLLFSAYTEAIFSKLIHTPCALTPTEIEQLKIKFKNNSYQGWVKCLELVINKIKSKDNNYKSTITNEMKQLLSIYIKKPSEVRNKIAHGQWKYALNTNNTSENEDITERINNLTVVDLTIYKKSFTLIAQIIEDLIESPDKAHISFYNDLKNKFNVEQQKMTHWTLSDRIARLRAKPSRSSS